MARPRLKPSPTFVRHSAPLLALKTISTAEAWSKERHPYKPLQTRFRHDGFDYRQIAREGDAAIYEQTWSGCSNPAVCYEVIRIRRREEFRIGNRFVETAEVYPKAKGWGASGWSFSEKDAAFAKLREIAASLNAPARFGQKRKRRRLEKSPT